MENRLPKNNLPVKDPKVMAHLFGLGLDCDDGHKRLTQADKFSIMGGSEPVSYTHLTLPTILLV